MKDGFTEVTTHAARRMAQRNVSLDDALLVICYGTVEHRTGVEFYFLAQRDIPTGRERQLERLVGTTVVVRSGRIETVYRNRRALPSIRRKSKLQRPPRPSRPGMAGLETQLVTIR